MPSAASGRYSSLSAKDQRLEIRAEDWWTFSAHHMRRRNAGRWACTVNRAWASICPVDTIYAKWLSKRANISEGIALSVDASHNMAFLTGHYHSIDLIRASEEDVRLIRGDGLTIHHPYLSEWIQNRSEKVYQGFFEKITIHINERITQRRCPKALKHVESLCGSFIGYFETSHAKLTLPFRKEFDPTKLDVKWRHIELDEDSEPYNFASIYYDNVELDDFEQDSVDEGFFLIDASEGIIELDVAEHNAAFTLKERKA